MKALFVAILALIFLASVLLDKAYRSVTVKELRRRARGTGDARTASIYKMASYGGALETFLWLAGGACAAGLFIIAARYAWWLALIVVLIAFWLVWVSRPLSRGSSFAWGLAAALAPPVTTLVGLLHPLLRRISLGTASSRLHTGLYEKEDLVQFIDSQNRQADNRIQEEDLRVALGALTFGDKSVSAVMTPKAKLKLVKASEVIGPHLMDELHASGFTSFPVVKSDKKASDAEIVGALYLSDVVEHPEGGRVRDVMKDQVYFINETQSLREALAAFLKTRAHFLVVVNNFEEVVGVLSIEDVLEQILGQKIASDFERYDDMRAVAGFEVESNKNHNEVTVAPQDN